MPKKLTYEYVKQKFNERGYTLLSEKYINAFEKLDYLCSQGHNGSIRWNDFQQNYGCSICANNSKIGIDRIREDFNNLGWILITEEYKNNKQPLVYICNKGSKRTITWHTFTKGKGCGCSLCSNNAKKSISFVKNKFKEIGWTLLSTEYSNNYTKLTYSCSNGHIWKISWNEFQVGNRCPFCSHKGMSKLSQTWLDTLGVPTEFREYKITLKDRSYIKADGFDPKTNTVYEFLGDFWHGNPESAKVKKEKQNKINKKLFKCLYVETFVRFNKLYEEGYNIIYIWEKDFLSGLEQQHIIYKNT